MEICEEMKKLRNALTERGIAWEDKSSIVPETHISKVMEIGISRNYADTSNFITHFEINGNKWSVINWYGTYGGYDAFTGKNYGMLECMASCVNNGDPVGNLTAEAVMQMVEQAM